LLPVGRLDGVESGLLVLVRSGQKQILFRTPDPEKFCIHFKREVVTNTIFLDILFFVASQETVHIFEGLMKEALRKRRNAPGAMPILSTFLPLGF
jgi:hypothetical protein